MYTDDKATQLLVALLKEYNIKNVVISPGTRNYGFAESIQQDDFFTAYSVIDERSAAYLATGIAFETGEAVVYGLYNAQERGDLFIGAGTMVYEGMIVGSNPKGGDIAVNVCKTKHLSNTRASGSDDALRLTLPVIMSLEKSLEYVGDDEYLEITPKSIRLRKIILNTELRLKAEARKKKAADNQ